MTYSQTDLNILARTIWGEARGEPFEGKVAVAWVILNRADKGGWWGSTITEVCKKPSQFSCWNANDPNSARLPLVNFSDASFPDCLKAVGGVLSGNCPDPTGAATHYHTLTVLPSWALNKSPITTIGQHVFYKLEA